MNARKMPRKAGPGRRKASVSTRGEPISSRVSKVLYDRLQALRTGPHRYTVSEVVAAGVEALERRDAE